MIVFVSVVMFVIMSRWILYQITFVIAIVIHYTFPIRLFAVLIYSTVNHHIKRNIGTLKFGLLNEVIFNIAKW